jgi:hypothetical protein
MRERRKILAENLIRPAQLAIPAFRSLQTILLRTRHAAALTPRPPAPGPSTARNVSAAQLNSSATEQIVANSVGYAGRCSHTSRTTSNCTSLDNFR